MSSSSLQDLFQERAQRFKKLESSIPRKERIKNIFDTVISKFKSRNKKKADLLERECAEICEYTSIDVSLKTIEDYAMEMYNGNDDLFFSFTQFLEKVKPKDVRIRELFERIRFSVPSSKPLMDEMEKILVSSSTISLDQVIEYTDKIQATGSFFPFPFSDVIDLTDSEEWFYAIDEQKEVGPFSSHEDAELQYFNDHFFSSLPVVFFKK